MKRIEGRAKTVKELMDGAKYTIDFYQREYAWQERQVRELIDDLTGKFLDFYEAEHERAEVESYGHYFLGSVVISHKNGKRYIVDGQQRLTTLTLLLIHLLHSQADCEGAVDVRKLVYSEKYGSKSFNLDVPDRNTVMGRLLLAEAPSLDGQSESVRNIVARYENIADHFPEEVGGAVLPFFVDWLLENVHLVEIEAYSDEDAYTIFETMNDRGLSLSLPEMLKGYVLANIRAEDDQKQVNDLWKTHMQRFKALGDEEDVDFFKNWLRAQCAETIRPGKKGAENKDYERIGSEFHRWVRDQKGPLGLADSAAFLRFVLRDLDFYAHQTQRIRQAAQTLTPGLESIRYNEERGFTLQTQLLLAPLCPDDPAEVVTRKLRLVADFLDIWLARRVWNFRTIAYSSVRYTLFTITKEVRGKSLPDLLAVLRGYLDAQEERFITQPKLRLHQQNYRQIRHILARLTYFVDTECGLAAHFDDLISAGRAKPYEIEHIWANHYDRYEDYYPSPMDFDVARNQIGGLILLQRGLNQSLNDASYEDKRDAYAVHSQNLLARSLNPMAYENNPAFRQFMQRTGLAFKPYDAFGPDEQAERQLLYIRLAEWVWNSGRLTLGEEIAPPVPEEAPEPAPKLAQPATEATAARYAIRRRFWEQLLVAAVERTTLHANVSPSSDNWVATGAGRSGVIYSYVLNKTETRVELYLSAGSAATNKAYFDQLRRHQSAIETAFGAALDWQRLDDKVASRICYTLESGGWEDEGQWDVAIPATIDAMIRLHAALSPFIPGLVAADA